MDHEYKLVKLHDFPHLVEEAACLLNSEWPRSLSARCHSLNTSSDGLPCSLLLLQVSDCNKLMKVVGYSRLAKVLHRPTSALVESVIIEKKLRGCGLGRKIMEHTENIARRLGYKTLHLSTCDKCMFYLHLGFVVSSAVSPETKVSRFLTKSQVAEDFDDQISSAQHLCNDYDHENTIKKNLDISPTQQAVPKSTTPNSTLISLPPPPPPPPPPAQTPPAPTHPETPTQQLNLGVQRRITWMKKQL